MEFSKNYFCKQNHAFASINNFREEGFPPLRDTICTILGTYCP